MITLTKEQLNDVLGTLLNYRDEDGKIDVDIEVSDTLTVNVRGWIEIDTEREDDYFNGTGYTYVRRNSSVTVTAQLYDEESNETTDDSIDKASENAINEFMNESEF